MKPVAITCGDPAGVGPEIISRWLAEHPAEVPPSAVIGPTQWLASLPDSVMKIPVDEGEYVLNSGQPSEEGAVVAFAALEEAAQGTLEGRYKSVVTAPVSKEWMKRAGFQFIGQTEFFADFWGGDPSMAFVGERLRVVLATWHIPLMEVGPALRNHPELLDRAVSRANDLSLWLGKNDPRIAVCGLNPHAGEGGLIGREEKDTIDPQLDKLRNELPGLSPCLPADTVFHRFLKDDFDCIVALYHDQGLGPFKTLEFDSGVNVTLGLPHLRVSPDHGTAFGIAGLGKASTLSFEHAVSLAHQLAPA